MLIASDGKTETLRKLGNEHLETMLQSLVHAHPEALPIAEIDPQFVGALAICRELQLSGAGAVDNFLITPTGLPVMVECKLWRNPEARRAVVGQILDYARVLSRWSVADLEREVRVRTKRGLFEHVRERFPETDEASFCDAVSHNLRVGRFLLIILGDGIREGVETLVEFMHRHAGLNFGFGLVEFPIYELANGEQILVPRVLARTTLITRHVVELPAGQLIGDDVQAEDGTVVDPDQEALKDERRSFWQEFLSHYLTLDDPEQMTPGAPRMGYITLPFPAPSGSSWLTVYRVKKSGELGLMLSSHRNSPGEAAMLAVADDWDEIRPLLAGDASLETDRYGRPRIGEARFFGNLEDPAVRRAGFDWLADRTNTYVNVLRPRVRDAVANAA
ncbi:hypothetical protein DLJ53_18705 [Acuticoccus sediminis]|uniref:DUF4268 domain-containing protein n=1 Tax=Acuticoccus sediminis TaxID=2184697 RepID=A0A8B2NRR1_9HYPH|nr:hypothetical protein DLJ53_18705 [Acuticoccus sediminis]